MNWFVCLWDSGPLFKMRALKENILISSAWTKQEVAVERAAVVITQ